MIKVDVVFHAVHLSYSEMVVVSSYYLQPVNDLCKCFFSLKNVVSSFQLDLVILILVVLSNFESLSLMFLLDSDCFLFPS